MGIITAPIITHSLRLCWHSFLGPLLWVGVASQSASLLSLLLCGESHGGWVLHLTVASGRARDTLQARALLASRVLMQLPAMSSGIGGLTILLEELVEELAPHVEAGRAASLPALQVGVHSGTLSGSAGGVERTG